MNPQPRLAEPAPAFGVYLHWPFCASKCPYCDFNSYVREAIDTTAWQTALVAELEDSAQTLWKPTDHTLGSVFFGGGTPSLMTPDLVATLIEKVCALWQAKPDSLEITLECNPSDLNEALCRAYKDAGVNRLSIGAQSFDDATLRFLGRRHNAQQARAALEVASKTFARVSLDMIYAHPDQTRAAWRADLAEGLAFATEHLSAYQLTLEPNTPFYAQARRGELSLPDEEQALALWNETQEATTKAGLIRYETSNHARGGIAGAARHNLEIWRGGDYAAIGPGAHGRATIEKNAHGRATIEKSAHGRATIKESAHGRATLNKEIPPQRLAVSRIASPERWLALRSQGKSTWHEEVVLSYAELRDELFLSGLRMCQGVSFATLARTLGTSDFYQALPDGARLARLLQDRLLVLDEAGLRASEAGAVRLNALVSYLFAPAEPALAKVAGG